MDNERMTAEELADLKRLEGEAASGPWEVNGGNHNNLIRSEKWGSVAECWIRDERRHVDNAAFIAASRAAIPRLIAEVERLRKVESYAKEQEAMATRLGFVLAEKDTEIERLKEERDQAMKAYDGRFPLERKLASRLNIVNAEIARLVNQHDDELSKERLVYEDKISRYEAEIARLQEALGKCARHFDFLGKLSSRDKVRYADKTKPQKKKWEIITEECVAGREFSSNAARSALDGRGGD